MAVNFELRLALKYFRARRRSLARLTAAAAVAGICCGVASLIVAQALTRGFRGEMQEVILSRTSHVAVFQTSRSGEIQNWRAVKREIERLENVSAVSPTTYESSVIISEKATSYAVLRAIQRRDAETPRIKESENAEKGDVQKSANGEKKIEDRSPKTGDQTIEISLGAELAEKCGLKPGDEAKIILPPSAEPAGYAPVSVAVRVREVFRTGLYDYDATWVYISFEDLARAAEKTEYAPSVLSVSVKDIYAAAETARKIREILPPEEGFKVLDWQEANRPLFAALSLERKVALAVISLIILIAALNITTTLALLVGERRLDIAVLRTCGARTKSVVLIFLLEGLFLGLTGIFLGVILGFAACFLGNRFKIVSIPAEVYSLSYVPLAPNANDLFLITAIAFSLSLAATVYPAWRAARIKPLENLRNQ